jgi:hypothetical protein
MTHGVIVSGAESDLGELEPGTRLSRSVLILNLSGKQLSVDAPPACSCSLPVLSTNRIQALGTARLVLYIDTTDLERGARSVETELLFRSGSAAWKRSVRFTFRVRGKAWQGNRSKQFHGRS